MSQPAIADALVATAWAALAADSLLRSRAERPAAAALGPVVGTGWQPGRGVQAIVLAGVCISAAALEVLSGRLAYHPGSAAAGLVLVAIGLALHIRARRALGPLWSGTVAVRAGHTVVDAGPYALVRHPIYLGVILLAAGSFLVHPSVATACLAIGLTAGFGLKIRTEERLLHSVLGTEYARYAARVPALLPHVALDDTVVPVLRALGHRLNPTRCRYALLLGATLWGGWVVSLALGPGLLDLTGQVEGTDFVQFYAAGRIVLDGAADRLYDPAFQSAVEHAITAPETWEGWHGFLNPPFFALIYVPLAALPYRVAFALWTLAGLGLVAASLRLLRPSGWSAALPWVLAFVPVFAAVSYGQNSLLSLFLLTATFVLLRRGADLAAGLVLGLLLYKPQLLAVLALALLLDRRWRALAGLAVTGALLGAASWLVSPAGAQAYRTLAQAFFTMQSSPGFPTWNMHSVYSFFVLLLPGSPAAARVLGLCGAVGVLVAMRRLQPRYAPATLPVWYAVALWATILASPHMFLYDLAILVPAGVLLWSRRRDAELWRGGLAVVWVVLVFSGPLTRALQGSVGFAVQLSAPVLALVGYALLRDAGSTAGDA